MSSCRSKNLENPNKMPFKDLECGEFCKERIVKVLKVGKIGNESCKICLTDGFEIFPAIISSVDKIKAVEEEKSYKISNFTIRRDEYLGTKIIEISEKTNIENYPGHINDNVMIPNLNDIKQECLRIEAQKYTYVGIACGICVVVEEPRVVKEYRIRTIKIADATDSVYVVTFGDHLENTKVGDVIEISNGTMKRFYERFELIVTDSSTVRLNNTQNPKYLELRQWKEENEGSTDTTKKKLWGPEKNLPGTSDEINHQNWSLFLKRKLMTFAEEIPTKRKLGVSEKKLPGTCDEINNRNLLLRFESSFMALDEEITPKRKLKEPGKKPLSTSDEMNHQNWKLRLKGRILTFDEQIAAKRKELEELQHQKDLLEWRMKHRDTVDTINIAHHAALSFLSLI